MAENPLNFSIAIRDEFSRVMESFRSEMKLTVAGLTEFRGELSKLRSLRAGGATKDLAKDLNAVRDASKGAADATREISKTIGDNTAARRKNREEIAKASKASKPDKKGQFTSPRSEERKKSDVKAQAAAQREANKALGAARKVANDAARATKNFTDGIRTQAAAAFEDERALTALEKEVLRVQAAIKGGKGLVSESELAELQAVEATLKRQIRIRRDLAQASQNVSKGLLTTGESPQQVERLAATRDLDKVRREQVRNLIRSQEAKRVDVKLTDQQRLAYGGLTEAEEALLRAEIRLTEAQRTGGDGPLRSAKAEAKAAEELTRAKQRQADVEARLAAGLTTEGKDAFSESRIAAQKAFERVLRDRAKAQAAVNAAANAGKTLTDKERLAIGGLTEQTERLLKAKEQIRRAEGSLGPRAAKVFEAEAQALREKNAATQKSLVLQERLRQGLNADGKVEETERLAIANRAVERALRERSKAQDALLAAQAKGVTLTNSERLAIGGLDDATERLLRSQEKLRREEERLGPRQSIITDAETRALKEKNDAIAKGQVLQARARLNPVDPNPLRRLVKRLRETNRGLKDAERNTKRLNTQLKQTNSGAQRLAFTFRRLFGVLAAFTAVRLAVRGFLDLIKAGVQFNATLEQTVLGIGSLVTAVATVEDPILGAVSAAQQLTLAQEEGTRQTQQLRLEALKTAATFEELQKAFQTAIAPGIQAGLDIDQIREISVRISQAATAIGLPQQQLAEEIRSLLQGTITARNTRIATSLGITNEDIERAKEAGELAEFLEERFASFGVAAEKALDTFAAKITNARDAVVQLVAKGSEGFFVDLKEALQAITDAIADTSGDIVIIRPEALAAAKKIGESLAFALDQAIKVAEELGFDSAEGAATALAQAIKVIALTAAGIAEGVAKGLAFLGSGLQEAVEGLQGIGLFSDAEDSTDAARKFTAVLAEALTIIVGISVVFGLVSKVAGGLVTTITSLGRGMLKVAQHAFLLPGYLRDAWDITKLIISGMFKLAKGAALFLFNFAKAHPILALISVAVGFLIGLFKDMTDSALGFEATWGEAFDFFLIKAKQIGKNLIAFGIASFKGFGVLVTAVITAIAGGLVFILQESVGALATLVAEVTGVGAGAAKALNDQLDRAADFLQAQKDINDEKTRGIKLDFQAAVLANRQEAGEAKQALIREAQARLEGIDTEDTGAGGAALQLDEYQSILSSLRPIVTRVTEGQKDLSDQFKELETSARAAGDAIRVTLAQEGLTGAAKEQAGTFAGIDNDAARASFKLRKDLATEEESLSTNRRLIVKRTEESDRRTKFLVDEILEKRRTINETQVELNKLIGGSKGDEVVGTDDEDKDITLRKAVRLDIIPFLPDKAKAEVLDIARGLQQTIDREEQRIEVALRVDKQISGNEGAAPQVQALVEEERSTRAIKKLKEDILSIETATRIVGSSQTIPAIREEVERATKLTEELLLRNVEETELLQIQERRLSLERAVTSSGTTTQRDRIELLKLEKEETLAVSRIELDRLQRSTVRGQQQRDANLLSLEKERKGVFALILAEGRSAEERLAAAKTFLAQNDQIRFAKAESLALSVQEAGALQNQELSLLTQAELEDRKLATAQRALDLETQRTAQLATQTDLLRSQALSQAVSVAASSAEFNVGTDRRLTDSERELEIAKIKTAETATQIKLLADRRILTEAQLAADVESAELGSQKEQALARQETTLRGITAEQNQLNEELRQQSFLLDEANKKTNQPLTFGARVAIDEFIADATDGFQAMVDIMTGMLEGFSQTAGQLLTDAIAGTGNTAKTKEAFGKLLQSLAVQFNTILIKFILGKFLSLLPKLAAAGDSGTAGDKMIAAAALWGPIATELLLAANLLLASGGGGAGISISGANPFGSAGASWTGGRAGTKSGGKPGAMHAVLGMSAAGGGRLSNPFSSARGFATGGSLSPVSRPKPRGTVTSRKPKRPAGLHPKDTIPIWAAADEWVIQSKSAMMYGHRVMRLINEGKIDPDDLRALAFSIPLTGRSVKAREIGFMGGGQVGGGTQFASQPSAGGGDGGPPVGFILMDSQEWDQLVAGGAPALDGYLESRRQFLKGLVS